MSKIVFDENALTIGDLEDFEDAIGVALLDALKPVPVKDEDGNVVRDKDGRPEQTVSLNSKTLKGLIWIAKRQTDPEFSLEDARNVRVTELDIVRAEDSEGVDPKE